MANGAIYSYTLETFAWIEETFFSENRSIQSKPCVKLANVSNERDSIALISITRACETNESHAKKYPIPCGDAREYPIPGAWNGSPADYKRNKNAIQTRKLSQYLARSAGKSDCINFLESNFSDSFYLDKLTSASSCISKPCHLKTSLILLPLCPM